MRLIPRFHLAFPGTDPVTNREFYSRSFGCRVGRESGRWIDFDFYGHQITAHLLYVSDQAMTNPVDGKQMPTRHFGVIFEWRDWHELADRLRARGQSFLIEPYIRFRGEVGEPATMFRLDPSGNGLGFKSFRDMSQIFAS